MRIILWNIYRTKQWINILEYKSEGCQGGTGYSELATKCWRKRPAWRSMIMLIYVWTKNSMAPQAQTYGIFPFIITSAAPLCSQPTGVGGIFLEQKWRKRKWKLTTYLHTHSLKLSWHNTRAMLTLTREEKLTLTSRLRICSFESTLVPVTPCPCPISYFTAR